MTLELDVIKNSKIRGVHFDNLLNFGFYTKATCNKLRKRNDNKLAGTSYGCSKEALSVAFKAMGRSVLNYAATIWTPTLSSTN